MEASLLFHEGIEGYERANDEYVALPGSSPVAAAIPRKAVEGALQRKSGRVVLMITICSVAAILFLYGTFDSNFRSHSEGGLSTEDDADEDDRTEFFLASRTSYHFQPEKNWMNDPNAPMFYKGYYHFFYQYNPNDVVLKNISWGHTVSKDLIHWMYLEEAFYPDRWYDADGVWSGSATILRDGTPIIIYTGAIIKDDPDNCSQSQNLALPVDPSDPLLRDWKKVDSVNPIITEPDGIRASDFRDPTTAWLEVDGLWRLAVGAKIDNPDKSEDGLFLLYNSKDLYHWEMEKYMVRSPGTGMWECVDFYPITVKGKAGLNFSVLGAETYVDTYKYVMKAGLQMRLQDHYTIGTYSTETHTFVPDDPALDIGLGFQYDYGKFYASKSFYDTQTGRRILWGWSNESDSSQDQVIKGWASVQGIPRTLWLDDKTLNSLVIWPVEEVESLRGSKASLQNINLEPTEVLRIQGGDGPQLDIVVDFEKPDVNDVDVMTPYPEEFDCSQGGSMYRGVFGPFGLIVHADENLTELTSVFFYLAPLKSGVWITRVCNDLSRSSLEPDVDKTVYGTYLTVLPDENVLSLRLLVDHSIVETFVQGGRVAITSRIYPRKAIGSRTRLFLFNNGTRPVQVKSLDVYQMNAVNMTNF